MTKEKETGNEIEEEKTFLPEFWSGGTHEILRHDPGPDIRGIWPAHDPPQSLDAMVQERILRAHPTGPGVGEQENLDTDDQYVPCQDAPHGLQSPSAALQAWAKDWPDKGRAGLQAAYCDDTAGLPILMYLTTGNVSDCKGARVLSDALPEAKALVADRGCDADRFREKPKAMGMDASIPPQRNRTEEIPCDRKLCTSRSNVERFIGRLKDCHRVATHCDKRQNVFFSACVLAAAFKFWP